jgi:hypothetical protein
MFGKQIDMPNSFGNINNKYLSMRANNTKLASLAIVLDLLLCLACMSSTLLHATGLLAACSSPPCNAMHGRLVSAATSINFQQLGNIIMLSSPDDKELAREV